MKRSIAFLLLCVGFLHSLPVYSQEATPTLVITEIMYDADGSDTGKEWVEMYNYGASPLSIITGSSQNALRFFDGTNHTLSLVAGTATIPAFGFAIIAADADAWIASHAGFGGTVFDTSMSLKNTSSTVGLVQSGGAAAFTTVLYESSWGGAGNGRTIEVADLGAVSAGQPLAGGWRESLVLGGTPGFWAAAPPVDTGDDDSDDSEDNAGNNNGDDGQDGGGADGDNGEASADDNGEDGQAGGEQSDGGDGAQAGSGNEQSDDGEQGSDSGEGDEGESESGQTENENSNDDSSGEHTAGSSGGNSSGAGSSSSASSSSSTSSGGASSTIPAIPSHTIRINEFLPNPHGSDETEWIELHHTGTAPVNLNGWYLTDASKRRYTFSGVTIAPGEYLLVARATSNISLNNTGAESVFLYTPNGTVHDSVSLSGTAPEGKSYARFDASWHWTSVVTPRAVNDRGANTPPVAAIKIADADAHYPYEEVLFDAKDSRDADGDQLSFTWNFGDGGSDTESATAHAYTQPGSYVVRLTVRDSRGLEHTAERTLRITTAAADEGSETETETPVAQEGIVVTEVMPNPDGADTGEWIELYNTTTSTISLARWQIDDAEGGSRPFTFDAKQQIAGHAHFLVERKMSGVALNNDADAVRLIAPDGRIVQILTYEKGSEGASYAFDMVDEEWFWTVEPTPGAANHRPAVQPKVLGSAIVAFDSAEADAGAVDAGEVLVSGVVIAPFGVMGARSMYVAPEVEGIVALNALLEVYSGRDGEVPAFSRGDRISAQGKLRRLERHDRVTVADPTSIVIEKTSASLPPSPLEAPVITFGDAFDATSPQWVRIAGTVSRVYQKSFSLTDPADSGGTALTVTVPEGDVSELHLEKGAHVEIAGLLRRESDRVRLWLTNPADVRVQEVVAATAAAGQTENSAATTTPGRSPQNGGRIPWWYLASIPGAALVGLIIKKYVMPKL